MLSDEMTNKYGKFTHEEFVQEFWNKVDVREPEECWEWQACRIAKGYGHCRWNGIYWKAHRISYVLAFGEIPDGLFVLHKCDNPPCVNPAHLFLGTSADNVQDMITKGRWTSPPRIGALNSNAKLTEENVIEIRKMHESGNYIHRELAVIFGVGRTQIGNIINRNRWNHIP